MKRSNGVTCPKPISPKPNPPTSIPKLYPRNPIPHQHPQIQPQIYIQKPNPEPTSPNLIPTLYPQTQSQTYILILNLYPKTDPNPRACSGRLRFIHIGYWLDSLEQKMLLQEISMNQSSHKAQHCCTCTPKDPTAFKVNIWFDVECPLVVGYSWKYEYCKDSPKHPCSAFQPEGNVFRIG